MDTSKIKSPKMLGYEIVVLVATIVEEIESLFG